MVLTQEEIDSCRHAFLAFDKDRSGTIDVWELRQVLEAMGQAPTEDELFQVRFRYSLFSLHYFIKKYSFHFFSYTLVLFYK